MERRRFPGSSARRAQYGITEDNAGEVVVLVGERVQLVEAGTQPLHAIHAAGLDRVVVVAKRWKGGDSLEALPGERSTEAGRHRHPALAVDLVDERGQK